MGFSINAIYRYNLGCFFFHDVILVLLFLIDPTLHIFNKQYSNNANQHNLLLKY